MQEVGQREAHLTKMFAKSNPKFAMIHRGHESDLILKMVHELELKERYNCYLVKNVADKRTIYDNFVNAIGEKCKEVLDRLREVGFYKLWETWNKLAGNIWFEAERRRTNQIWYEAKADFISFSNLLSFQIVFGVLLGVAGLVFVCEMVMRRFRFTIVQDINIVINVDKKQCQPIITSHLSGLCENKRPKLHPTSTAM